MNEGCTVHHNINCTICANAAERDRLRRQNAHMLKALKAANIYLLQTPAVDDYYERTLNDVELAIAECEAHP